MALTTLTSERYRFSRFPGLEGVNWQEVRCHDALETQIWWRHAGSQDIHKMPWPENEDEVCAVLAAMKLTK